MRKTPEQKKLLRELQETLPYVIQELDPNAHGEEGEWQTRWDLGEITGKGRAYDRLDEMRLAEPQKKWRILARNEADMYEHGIRVGMKLAGSEPTRRPLMYIPDEA